MDLGSGISLYNNDQYKLLAAEIQTQSKKLISFQHGGNFGKFNFSIQDEMEKSYCRKRFLWHQKGGIGDTYLSKFNSNPTKSKAMSNWLSKFGCKAPKKPINTLPIFTLPLLRG